MGIREQLNKNPAITTGITGGIIAIALLAILYQSLFSGASPGPITESFYTVDDGKTWFVDDSKLIPPFDKDGKPAVRAFVYTCDGGKTKWVAYMERYTEKGRKIMMEMEAKAKSGEAPAQPGPEMFMSDGVQYTEREIKEPGGAKWFKSFEPGSAEIMQPKCPEGQSEANLEPVMP
jgi:hypothetical protein